MHALYYPYEEPYLAGCPEARQPTVRFFPKAAVYVWLSVFIQPLA